MDINEKLEILPEQPGIYRFFSKSGKIIYIGKAKNLKNRVRSYFLNSNLDDQRIMFLVANIHDVEWIVTHTETEALILEDQLIKTHRPRYNVQLKDDKTYPYFKLSINELYPRLTLVREIEEDGSLYFGPYVAVGKARNTMKTIKRHFPLRQSSMSLDGKKTFRPCINLQMKKCLAPCAGLITPEQYAVIVTHVSQLLKGNYDELIRSLKAEMAEKSQHLKFEEAAVIRDQINAVRNTLQKQRVVSKQKIDRDIFALVRSGGFAGIQVLFVRNGILISDDFFFIKQAEQYEDQEIIRSILSNFYVSGGKAIPREILLTAEYENATMLEEYCSTQRNSSVKILFPKQGEKKATIELAVKNGEQNLSIQMRVEHADQQIIKEVQKILKLKNLPNRVECFDISNISGTNNVASMVVWENNRALKSAYRKYKIKSFEGANDYAAMEEVLTRRYKKVIETNQSLPDMIVVDGGKGQLGIAIRILVELGIDLDKTDLIGLAKGRSEQAKGIDKGTDDYEYVVKPRRKNAINLKKNSSTLFFLQNIRDEAHRFAITYHRQVRRKKSIQSELDTIPGIGPQKRKILLKTFIRIKKIREADVELLQAVKGISKKDATAIFNFFSR